MSYSSVSDFSGEDFSARNLSGADLSGDHFNGANFRGANLKGANLRGTYLNGANLNRANLSEAKFRGTKFSGANLSMADLSGTDLSGTDFSGVNLSGTNLSEADLSGYRSLSGTDLSGANLKRANLEGSRLKETKFLYVNLAEAKNLDTCRHDGPSFLDFHTLQLSGSLPLSFLRACGLSDQLINYLPSLLDQPIQYCSCFISYSSKNEDFAQRLYADLQSKNVRCWFAPEDIKGGQKLHDQIGEAIRLHEQLLLVLSEHSMNSEWVKTEIAKARQHEVHEKRKVLFPIRLVDFKTIQQWECFDADTGKDSAKEIREYFIPDFSDWKNYNAYQQAFKRLLQNLKPELECKPVE